MNGNKLIEAAEEVLETTTPSIEERPAIPQELQDATFEMPEEAPYVETNITSSLPVVPTHSAEIIEREQTGTVCEMPSAPLNATPLQKFGELPAHLREGEGIDLHEIRKLNLAVAVEALERASSAHESYPSPDAGMAVAQLNEMILKLTKDLEKSKDPKLILDDIMESAISHLTKEIVQDLASEMKKLKEETLPMIRSEKKEAFSMAFNTAVNRMGPAMKERLEIAKNRIARALNVKE